MPGKDRLRNQGDVIVKPFAGKREKVVKHLPHRQHGGAGIHRAVIGWNRTRLAADSAVRFDQRDLHPRRLQANGGGEAAHSGTDDNGLVVHPAMMSCEGNLSSLIYTFM